MKRFSRNFWFTAVLLACLAPSTFAVKPNRDRGCDGRHNKKCQQVPEGGSALIYVLGAGVACLGAVFSRNRVAKLNNA